jgi:hypothetical protein
VGTALLKHAAHLLLEVRLTRPKHRTTNTQNAALMSASSSWGAAPRPQHCISTQTHGDEQAIKIVGKPLIV